MHQIIKYCHRMDQKGWVANHDGNISVLTQSGKWQITPTARAKFDLSEQDLIEVDAAGKVLSGNGKPFSEFAVHQKIYQVREDVKAVVHAHPPNATAVGCAGQEMLTSAVPEAVVSLGPGVPVASLQLPNSEPVLSEVAELAPHYNAIMVSGNGVFSWGDTLELAFLRMELVEHLATIFLKSMSLGGPQLLNGEQVSALLKKRDKAGLGLPTDPQRPHWFND